MKNKLYLIILLFFTFLFYPGVSKSKEDNKIVMMKPVTVEGEVDKPAIIIIPKAKLYEYDMFHKSFYREITRVINISDFKLSGTKNRSSKRKKDLKIISIAD